MGKVFGGINSLEDLQLRKRRLRKALSASQNRLDHNLDSIGEALNPVTYLNKAISSFFGGPEDKSNPKDGHPGKAPVQKAGSRLAGILLNLLDRI